MPFVCHHHLKIIFILCSLFISGFAGAAEEEGEALWRTIYFERQDATGPTIKTAQEGTFLVEQGLKSLYAVRFGADAKRIPLKESEFSILGLLTQAKGEALSLSDLERQSQNMSIGETWAEATSLMPLAGGPGLVWLVENLVLYLEQQAGRKILYLQKGAADIRVCLGPPRVKSFYLSEPPAPRQILRLSQSRTKGIFFHDIFMPGEFAYDLISLLLARPKGSTSIAQLVKLTDPGIPYSQRLRTNFLMRVRQINAHYLNKIGLTLVWIKGDEVRLSPEEYVSSSPVEVRYHGKILQLTGEEAHMLDFLRLQFKDLSLEYLDAPITVASHPRLPKSDYLFTITTLNRKIEEALGQSAFKRLVLKELHMGRYVTTKHFLWQDNQLLPADSCFELLQKPISRP